MRRRQRLLSLERARQRRDIVAQPRRACIARGEPVGGNRQRDRLEPRREIDARATGGRGDDRLALQPAGAIDPAHPDLPLLGLRDARDGIMKWRARRHRIDETAMPGDRAGRRQRSAAAVLARLAHQVGEKLGRHGGAILLLMSWKN
ncbi:hypothetical protein [Sphingopyxis sp.]|uniref:hypothetical protein n=1 Tax=Sphingopyxis sp. TaxID=1908224 RepID=UPI0010F675C5|nr:hypothetical protein [Sphingopyxis sp.]MBR2174149.1 hypothetical protein [Sphingopyxis sp.]